MFPWCVVYDKDPYDKRLGVKVGDIISANDGDVCLAAITSEIISKNSEKNNAFFVDIGFAQGWWSSFVSTQNPNASIIGFEPNKNSYEESKQICKIYKNITLHNVAISDSEGLLQFNSSGEQSNSRLEKESATEFVTCSSLKTFIGDTPVNLLKIDTEGHDLVILKSILPYINQIQNVVFECSVYWYDKDRLTAIEKTFEIMMALMKNYRCMCGLSRRGNPVLYYFENEMDILRFLAISWDNQFQIDILMTNTDLETIKKVSIKELIGSG